MHAPDPTRADAPALDTSLADTGTGPPRIDARTLAGRIMSPRPPIVVDVRRRDAYEASHVALPTARWRDHRLARHWSSELPPGREVIVYCVHGHQVSHAAVAALDAAGLPARVLAGGIEGFVEAGGARVDRESLEQAREGLSAGWVLPAPVRIDSAASAWLLRRYVGPDVPLHFAPTRWVPEVAQELGARPVTGPDELADSLGIEDAATAAIIDLLRGPTANPMPARVVDGLTANGESDRATAIRAEALFDGLHGNLRRLTSVAA